MFSRGERSLYCSASSWPTSERKPLFTPGWPMSCAIPAMSSVCCSSSERKPSEQVACMMRAAACTTSRACAKLWNGTGRYSFSTAVTNRCRSCTSSVALKKPSEESWKRETAKTARAVRWALVSGSGLKDHETKTSCDTPKSSNLMDGAPSFLRWVTTPDGLRPSILFASSTMFFPCSIVRMPQSSSRKSSLVSGMFLAVCRSAMMASFWTTFSNSFISLELSTSTASSSGNSWTTALNLKTVEAICRTVDSMRSKGRTVSSVTTLESVRPLKSMMPTMKIIVAMAKPASICAGACMLKATMKVLVCTRRAEDSRGGAERAGDQSHVPSLVQRNPGASEVGTPLQTL
mmetsp:Transcript_57136/g.138138  ORF Transcript_57136/g.138138 Transcript_57136/m.138138 type:complete len:347 (+) Transcript_57136:758-1798(+)